MSEPTLTITYAALRERIGHFLGYTRTPGDWSASQIADIDDCLVSGMRQFYGAQIIGPGRVHEWSFLRPWADLIVWSEVTGTVDGSPVYVTSSTITATTASFHPSMIGHSFVFDASEIGYTVTGYTSSTVIVVEGDASGEDADDTFTITPTGAYRLPDDFGSLHGDIMYDEGNGPAKIGVSSSSLIRNRLSASDSSSGKPTMAAVEPVVTDGTVGQRFDLWLYPVPDTEYTLKYRYTILPDALTTDKLYPYGAQQHSASILESCLAMAERYIDDQQGLHAASYERSLQVSIGLDRQATTPEWFGTMNVDPAGGPRVRRSRSQTVTYNGVDYS